MNNGASEADQVVRLAVDGTMFLLRISGKASMEIIKFLAAAASEQARTSGKVRLKNLLRSGSELKVFSLSGDENFQTFAAAARDYGVVYSVVRQTDSDAAAGIYDIMVRAEDASKMNRIIEKFNLIQIRPQEGVSVQAEEIDPEYPMLNNIPECRDIMSGMFTQDSSEEQTVNPEAAPERDDLSGASYRTYDKDEPSKRPSVKEEIEKIHNTMEKTDSKEQTDIISGMLQPDEASEAEKKFMENMESAYKELMENVREGENANASRKDQRVI